MQRRPAGPLRDCMQAGLGCNAAQKNGAVQYWYCLPSQGMLARPSSKPCARLPARTVGGQAGGRRCAPARPLSGPGPGRRRQRRRARRVCAGHAELLEAGALPAPRLWPGPERDQASLLKWGWGGVWWGLVYGHRRAWAPAQACPHPACLTPLSGEGDRLAPTSICVPPRSAGSAVRGRPVLACLLAEGKSAVPAHHVCVMLSWPAGASSRWRRGRAGRGSRRQAGRSC